MNQDSYRGKTWQGNTPHCVIITHGHREACARIHFKLLNSVSLIVSVNLEGESFLPAPVFRRDYEPKFTIKLTRTTISKVVTEGWKSFRRKDIASIDTKKCLEAGV